MPAVAFVINGTLGRAGHRFQALCQAVAKHAGWQAELLVTHKAEDGTEAARGAALGGADVVVAAGGDGTVRCCAEALAGTGVPLGIVGMGTANLLARTLGVPHAPRAALALALGLRPWADRRIDMAVADGIPYTAMAGLGLDAAVVAATHLKHQLGWWAYAASGATHLVIPPAEFTITCDGGRPFTRVARCVVGGNTGLLPGGFALLPDARLDDGVLDVGVLAPAGALGWTRVATRVLLHSRHDDRQLERLRARHIAITADVPLPREVDGEVIFRGQSLTMEVRPGILVVRAPR